MTPPGVLVFDGDSVSRGYGVVEAQTPAARLAQLMDVPVRIVMAAESGKPVSASLADFPSRVAPHHDPAAPFNIVLFHGGDNDIAAGRTAGQAADSLGRYVALAHAQGWTVIVSTELGRPDWSPSAQAALAEYNVLELRNAAGADLVIDYANASGMADPDARASGGLYNADGVHPGAAGYAVLADLLRQAIATVRSRG